MVNPNPAAAARRELKRGVGAWGAVAVNVANMIGTGVFLKTRVMTCNVGNAKTVLLVWIAAGLLSLAGTFSYSEIAAMMPEAGGDYVYLRRAYGRLVAFLYGWMTFAVAKAGSQAALAVGLAIFMNVALGGVLKDWRWLGVGGLTLVALAAIWTVALINCASVSAGGRMALGLTIAKVGLVLGVGVGAFLLAPGSWSHLGGSAASGTCEGVAASARGGIAGFGAAMLGALWAYDGWNNVAPLSGEIRDPQRNLPRALFLGMLGVITAYTLVNVAYLAALGHSGLALSQTPASDVMQQVFGNAGAKVIAVGIAISALGFCNITLVAGARVLQVMGADGLFFSSVARLHPRHHTPNLALLLLSGWSIVLAVSGSYGQLLDYATFGDWLACAVGVATLFWYRRQQQGPVTFRVPAYPLLPLVFIATVAVVVVQSLRDSLLNTGMGLLIILAGVPVYLIWRRLFSPART